VSSVVYPSPTQEIQPISNTALPPAQLPVW
jgi:hypothetical protein